MLEIRRLRGAVSVGDLVRPPRRSSPSNATMIDLSLGGGLGMGSSGRTGEATDGDVPEGWAGDLPAGVGGATRQLKAAASSSSDRAREHSPRSQIRGGEEGSSDSPRGDWEEAASGPTGEGVLELLARIEAGVGPRGRATADGPPGQASVRESRAVRRTADRPTGVREGLRPRRAGDEPADLAGGLRVMETARRWPPRPG
ncbi:hypothetical protein ZWY2020_015967 [Hordeum vulgare]|nr:hypothetical protein ZWY2020_015967 [Hordeum vulgare]